MTDNSEPQVSGDGEQQVSESQIAVHWREEEYYHPPESFVAQANANDPAILDRFTEDKFPDCFIEYADLLSWDERWHTVLDTSTSEAPAVEPTRAPMCTAIPATSSPRSSHSPVCRPARISSPSWRTPSRIAQAALIPRAGPSKLAKKPSPAVSTSKPRCWSSTFRTRV